MLCTPRWYTYGGMFHSLFLAVNLARFYRKKLVLLYPRSHLVPELARPRSGSAAPAFLNHELRQIVVDGRILQPDTLEQKMMSRWLDFNRLLWRNAALRKLLAGVRLFLGRGVERLLPTTLGYTGLDDSMRLQRLLAIPRPVRWKDVFENPTFIELTEDQRRRGEEILLQMGISPGKHFICLYVRDSGFEATRSTVRGSMENADIENFREAISFLEDRGYYVLRVGEPSMVPFSGGGDRFIDYVHTKCFSHVLSLYLYRHCDFWVGTTGGGRSAPLAYGTPAVVVNGVYPCQSGYCVLPDDVYLPKNIYARTLKRFLSLREQLEKIDQLSEQGLWNTEYIAVENTPEQIATIVKEFCSWKSDSDFDWNKDLQSQYWMLKNKRVKEALFDPGSGRWRTVTVEEAAELQPYISRKFLEDCWDDTDYLKELTDFWNRFGSLQGFRRGAW